MIPSKKRSKLRVTLYVTIIGVGAALFAPSSVKQNAAKVSNLVVQEQESSELADSQKNGTKESINIGVNPMNGVTDSDTTELFGTSENNAVGLTQESSEDQNDGILNNEGVEAIVEAGITGAQDAANGAQQEEDEEPAPKFYTVGVNHRTVAEIQQRLMDLGFMEDAEPTEYYGNITASAVMQFQRQNDLKQDGIIGPDSLAMLKADNAKHYAAKLGMDGDDIRRIQNRLYELGYIATADQVTGHFGDVTEAAVKKMQRNNGLSDDGKVGEQTVELLYSEDVKPNLISYGEQSDIVLECQKRLQKLGYLTTTPDGKYGNDTAIAVKQFQSRNDLVVDGFLGPTTRQALMSSAAAPNGLVIGDDGDSVRRVQELLNKYGYISSSNVTGYFGDVTEAAVKSFQSRNGLTADGNVGAMTMNKLTSGNVVKASSTVSGTESNQGSSSKPSTSKPGSSNSGSSNSGSSSSTNSSASALVSVAKSKVGAPYVLGAKGPSSFDCSGFVYWCLNQVGVKQSYLTSSGWRSVGKYKRISSLSSVKAGDIIVVSGHVGIAAGNNMVIDASSSSGKIVYRQITSWWSSRFIVAWRIFG